MFLKKLKKNDIKQQNYYGIYKAEKCYIIHTMYIQHTTSKQNKHLQMYNNIYTSTKAVPKCRLK